MQMLEDEGQNVPKAVIFELDEMYIEDGA